MKDKEIIKQLAVLRQIKAPQDNKKERRAMFFAQIGANKEKNSQSVWSIFRAPFLVIRYMSQSMMVAFLLLFIFVGGVSGLWAARDTKPGDSLYLAKIAGEKTQLALTFNEKKKVHLGLAFAGKRAKEIRQLLAEDNSSEKKDARVEKLVFNFKKEISSAKATLQKISQQEEAKAISSKEEQIDKLTTEKNTEAGSGDDDSIANEEELVFSAGSEKDKNGLEVKEVGINKEEPAQNFEKTAPDFVIKDASTTLGAELSASSADIIIEDSIGGSANILAQANQLLHDEEYKEALDVLSQAEELISEALDEGAVKGIEEEATTTQPVIDNPEQGDILATTSEEGE